LACHAETALVLGILLVFHSRSTSFASPVRSRLPGLSAQSTPLFSQSEKCPPFAKGDDIQ
jgi:hypothetical protein